MTVQLPDDWVDGVGILGIILLVYGSAYLTGRRDASGMPTSEWANHVASNGPLWPAAVSVVGFVLLGTATVLLVVDHYR